MKALALLVVSMVALASHAHADDGTAELVIYPDNGNGYLTTDLRQDNGKILGSSFSGNEEVNLQIVNGKYKGATGHDLTALTCNESGCSGFINGQSTDLKGDSSALEGTIGGELVNLKRTAVKITVAGARASMELTLTKAGHYSGTGWSPYFGTFTVELNTTGTLDGLSDAGLEAIFLLAPLSGH